MCPAPEQDVTVLLQKASEGDAAAADALLPTIYEALRQLAERQLAREAGRGAGMTLQATALVHEAYARLVSGGGAEIEWQGRRHFFNACALAMRRILVERARRKRGPKAGGGRRRVDLASAELEPSSKGDLPDEMNWIDLDQAMARLNEEDPTLAEVVHLRYFAGLSVDETALALNISARTVDRHWKVARAWLHDELQRAGEQE
jgi:RNA polymerase sigma factor (TIGR02999 family)